MVAPHKAKKVFCTVVRVPTTDVRGMSHPPARLSELLPWADPYIVRLVKKLQGEVRRERSATRGLNSLDQTTLSKSDYLTADLDPPDPCFDSEWEWSDEPRRSFSDEPTSDYVE